ncbi:hypothetical protein VPH35_108830 [Triticum aestivum]
MPGNKKNNKVVRLGNVIERLGKLTGVIKKGTGATRSTQVGRAKPAQRATVDGTQGRRNGRTLVSRVASPIPSAHSEEESEEEREEELVMEEREEEAEEEGEEELVVQEELEEGEYEVEESAKHMEWPVPKETKI